MTGIVDAHHHIWRQADLPWLSGPMQPRIFGPYEPIRRDYPMSEFLADNAPSGVEKSVYVQVNWAPERFEDEVAWVHQQADETGWPHAVVGYADFLADDVRPQLDRLKAYPLMRGIRMQLHWHENQMYRFAAQPDLCLNATLQRNIGYLADYDWIFELQVFSPQMAGAADLADACPDVTFVLQHAGMLEDTSTQGRAAWQTGMGMLSACPNVVCKLSGLGTFVHRNDPAHIGEMITTAHALFGKDRCLFGSNFPIEKLWTSYADLIDAYKKGASPLRSEAQTAIFSGTAERIYRI